MNFLPTDGTHYVLRTVLRQWAGQASSSTVSETAKSTADRQWVVTCLGIDQDARTQIRTLTARAPDPDFDLPIRAAGSSGGGVAQRVLIAGIANGALISVFKGVLGIIAKYICRAW